MTADTLPAGAVEPIEGDELAVRHPFNLRYDEMHRATLAELVVHAIGAHVHLDGTTSYHVATATLFAADEELRAIVAAEASTDGPFAIETADSLARMQERMRIGAELARRLREREAEDAVEDKS